MVQKVLIEDDEVPKDINGFLCHPLNSSFPDNDGAKALLHEYKNLPAIHMGVEDSLSESECIETCEDKKFADCDEILNSESTLIASVDMNDNSSNQDELERIVEDIAQSATNEANVSKVEFENNNMDCDNDLLNEALNGMDSNMLNELIEASPKESSDQDIDIDTDTNDISKLLDSTGHLPFNNDSNNNDIAQPAKCKMNEESISPVSESCVKTSENMLRQNHTMMNTPSSCLPQPPPMQFAPTPPVLGQNCSSKINRNDSTMTCPIMPRFMSPMVVQTSTAGALQIQPVILNNRDICFTQPIPYRPHSQPYAPVGMQWAPNPYYQYNMGHQMMYANGVRMPAPHQVYYPQAHIPIMQTQMPIHCDVTSAVAPVTVPQPDSETTNSLLQPHINGTAGGLLTCSTNKNEVKMSNQSVLPNNSNGMDQSWALLNDADKMSYGLSNFTSTHSSQSNNKAQRACAVSNVPPGNNTTSYLKKHASAMHLKSPDSGFSECLQETVPCSSESEVSNYSNPASPLTESRAMKRKRKSICAQSKLCANKPITNSVAVCNFLKREPDETGYQISLDASTSCGAKLEDDRMTYLNKGQYYKLNMRNSIYASQLRGSYVKSVITLRFREDNSYDVASKYWHFWQTHQPNVAEAKGLDIDFKNSTGIVENTLEYNGINSLTFAWNTHESVQAELAVHCLSTDFSSQKGVKGLPLHIQIDTYDGMNSIGKNPVHRAYAQIKIFCEKGAERKARDEEKRKEKSSLTPSDALGTKQVADQYQPIETTTEFYSMEDLSTDVYIHKVMLPASDVVDDPFTTENGFSDHPITNFMDSDFMYSPAPKQMRFNENTHTCIYVRETHDVAFTALYLTTPSTKCLADAIKEKYEYISEIHMLYKRTSRGMLVKMDDSLVKHLLHESMFVIEFKECPDSMYDVTLTETDS